MLARASRKAFGMQKSVLDAAATYGCAVVGMADSHVLQLRRSAAKLHPRHRGKSCLTGLLATTKG
eukprot:534254-Alexandrium_andersonii.AAC.1